MPWRYRRVYRFTVALTRLRPRIWRRIEVPGNYSFWDLHVALQDVMDWPDARLHEFEIDGARHDGGTLRLGGGSPQYLEDGEFHLPEVAVPLSRFFARAGDVAYYIYDFRCTWVLKIVLEAIAKREPRVRYPRCLKGARAAPPADSGGPFAYGQMVGMFENPDDPNHARVRRRLGDSFDPRAFDPTAVRFHDPRKRWWEWFDLSSRDGT